MSDKTKELTRTTPVVDGEILPLQHREFEISEFKKLPKLSKKAAKAAREEQQKAVREARIAAGEDPEDIDDDEQDEGPDEERFEIAISSEFPVRRWFGNEVLDHTKDAIDLSRAKKGLAFLDSHDTKSIVGIVTGIKLGDDKVLRGVVQFSRNPRAQEVKRDVTDGIRKYISVGYGVNEYTIVENSDDKIDTYRATNWTPMEASSVAVPADPSVGHNRKAGERGFPVKVRNISGEIKPTEQTQEERTMAEKAQETTDSLKTAGEIIKLGKRHGIDPERVATWVTEGRSLDAVSSLVLDEIASRSADPLALPAAEKKDEVRLTEREQKQYNLARGILMQAMNRENGKAEKCFEMEVSDEIEKRSKTAGHGGLFVPWSIRTGGFDPKIVGVQSRAGLSSNVATTGQELKFVEPGEFIDFLYNQMRVKDLGARTISGLRDNVSFPKQSGRATGSWVGENPGVDVADSNLTLGTISSSPKTYQSSTSYSRQLLAQAVIDVDSLVREDLAKDLALAIDSVAITGTGTSNQPTGILNTSGVQAYSMISDAGNGGLPAWDDVVLMTEQLEDVNADQLGEGAWLTTPPLKSRLKRLARLGNTQGFPIWMDDDTVDGYRARSSNQVPKTLTKGTGTNLQALIRGIFETMIIGMWGSGFELVVDPYRLKKQGMIELTTFMLVDVVLRYPQAFVVATDVIK